ncbi:hypothetical protein GQX74_001560 [Glossina fuscipes]|nr:hypothetical protein GQX74_001560 [Glossina fuscipes]
MSTRCKEPKYAALGPPLNFDKPPPPPPPKESRLLPSENKLYPAPKERNCCNKLPDNINSSKLLQVSRKSADHNCAKMLYTSLCLQLLSACKETKLLPFIISSVNLL